MLARCASFYRAAAASRVAPPYHHGVALSSRRPCAQPHTAMLEAAVFLETRSFSTGGSKFGAAEASSSGAGAASICSEILGRLKEEGENPKRYFEKVGRKHMGQALAHTTDGSELEALKQVFEGYRAQNKPIIPSHVKSFIHACVRLNNPAMAAACILDKKTFGLFPDISDYHYVIKALSADNDANGVVNMFERMVLDQKDAPSVQTYQHTISALLERAAGEDHEEATASVKQALHLVEVATTKSGFVPSGQDVPIIDLFTFTAEGCAIAAKIVGQVDDEAVSAQYGLLPEAIRQQAEGIVAAAAAAAEQAADEGEGEGEDEDAGADGSGDTKAE